MCDLSVCIIICIWLHLNIQQAVDDDDDHVLYGRGHDVTRRSCVLVIVDIISLIWEFRERRKREGGREREKRCAHTCRI